MEAARGFARWGAASVLVPLALLLASCNSLLVPGAQPPGGFFASPSETPRPEPISSAEHARIVAAYGGVYEDPGIERTLAAIVGRLVAASDPGQAYRVTILNAATVNAFALPGGSLYITRGLLALANDSSEVAAVIAHEMAHVTADHALARMSRAQTAVIVGEAVNGALDSGSATAVSLESGQRSLASFSRQQELEADAIGVATLAKAGYDPFAASRFLRSLAAFAAYRASIGVPPDQRPEFLASHPSTPERIAAAETVARALGVAGSTDQSRYLAGINELRFGDDAAQGYVRGQNYFHPGLGIGFSVPAGFVLENTAAAVIATSQNAVAMRFDAVNLRPGMSLSDYLASGWINGLDQASIRTFETAGLPAASGEAAAQAWVFSIAVISTPGGATYRFIFASDARTPAFQEMVRSTTASFRRLTTGEAASLTPLRVRIVTVRAGETQEMIAAQMRGVPESLGLFRVLNNLRPGEPLATGASVKIVTD